MAICEAPGCANDYAGRRMCPKHYYRFRRYGSYELPQRPPKPPTRYLSARGYTMVYVPGHPMANSAHVVFEHRLVMAEHLGRNLLPRENVHHLNGDKLDNRIENLELWVRSQPAGQRVTDQVEWALRILRDYAPAYLAARPNTPTLRTDR